ncbi:hypothetical protein ACNR9V_07680 [Parageobacillus thermoglucosidasius]|uniref:hypothetical protein n=1 Tax=Parageobacillus thermoglucosidasius TaxID=1426 RepID=UPI003B66DAD3
MGEQSLTIQLLTSKGIGKACGKIFHIAGMTVSPISKTTSSVCSEADEIFCILFGIPLWITFHSFGYSKFIIIKDEGA